MEHHDVVFGRCCQADSFRPGSNSGLGRSIHLLISNVRTTPQLEFLAPDLPNRMIQIHAHIG